MLSIAHPSPGQPLLSHCGLEKEESNYIFHTDDTEDLGPGSLQCGRKVDVLKIWLTWYLYGTQGLGQQVEDMVALATYAEQQINASKHLELLAPRESICVCFRFIGTENSHSDKAAATSQQLNQLNKAIRDQLLQSGDFMINYGWIDNALALRLVTVNNRLTTAHLDQMLDLITHTG